MALLGKFLDDIAAERCGINDVVVALLGIPHRKTVVVAAGEADILCTGVLYGCHPLLCIETVGVERIGGFCIFILVNRVVLQVPLALCKHAVYSPVYEYSELAVGKLLACLQVFGSRGVLRLCGCRCNGQQCRCHQHESFYEFHIKCILFIILCKCKRTL